MDNTLIEQFKKEWLDNQDTIVTPTSGTTKGSKPITLYKADMELSAGSTLAFLDLTRENMTFVSSINPNYIGGKMMILRSIIANAKMIQIEPSLDPAASLPSDIGTIDLWAIVPAQVEALLMHNNLPAIRNIIIGGAPLPTSLEQLLIKTLPQTKIYATYGMTETASHVALRLIGTDCYKALPGVTFSVDNNSCLVIHRESASWGQIKTRDVVELISPTAIKWKGRADNIINTGGIKVHPEELEAKIREIIPALPAFYITSQPHEKWGEFITLVIETNYDFATEPVLEVLKEKLPRKLVPKAIKLVKIIKRTKTGKIKRDKLY